MAKTVALLTDFGLADPYAGIMKGVISRIAPEVQFVDLCHNIQPHDVPAAAFALQASVPYFSNGTIFVAVVDPGVGSQRRAILIKADEKYLIAPDNGLLSLALSDTENYEAVVLKNREFFLPETSTTFHARDIFAPVAAHVAQGVDLPAFGPPAGRLTSLKWPQPVRVGPLVRGEIIHVDRFGNLITNIGKKWLTDVDLAKAQCVLAGRNRIHGMVSCYANAGQGRLAALVNSMGLVEFSMFKKSAQKATGATCGAKAEIEIPQ